MRDKEWITRLNKTGTYKILKLYYQLNISIPYKFRKGTLGFTFH